MSFGGFPDLNKRTDVPIIGAPYTLKNWCITVMLVCGCEKKEPVLFVGQLGTMAQCPACQKVYQLQAFGMNPDKTIQFGFAIGLPAAPVVN